MSCMDDLSIELLVRIIDKAQFSPLQICSLSLLSREWREATSSSSIWKSLELKVPEYSENVLLSISKYCGNLEELHVSRDPHYPRPLTMMSCGEWMDGMEHILSASQKSLKRLVLSTGCNTYLKDYRSSSFYMYFMKKIARLSNELEQCDIYYNVGKCFFGRDVNQWFKLFMIGCPKLKSFRFWAPSGDCGGMDDDLLGSMAEQWLDIEMLELSGEDITLEGIFNLRACKKLKNLKLKNISLGPLKRTLNIEHYSILEDHYFSYLSIQYLEPSPVEDIVLISSQCDLWDLKLIWKMFPSLKCIHVIEKSKAMDMEDAMSPDFDSDDSPPPVSDSSTVFNFDALNRACFEEEGLKRIVKFSSL